MNGFALELSGSDGEESDLEREERKRETIEQLETRTMDELGALEKSIASEGMEDSVVEGEHEVKEDAERSQPETPNGM